CTTQSDTPASTRAWVFAASDETGSPSAIPQVPLAAIHVFSPFSVTPIEVGLSARVNVSATTTSSNSTSPGRARNVTTGATSGSGAPVGVNFTASTLPFFIPVSAIVTKSYDHSL